jgi:hypothetical protein
VFAPEEKKKVSLRVSRSETSLKGNILAGREERRLETLLLAGARSVG